MEPLSTVVGAVMSIALGGLVGLEREFGKEVEKKKLLIGIRTSILLCLLGFLSVVFQEYMEPNLSIALGFMASLVALSLSYLSRLKLHKLTGITTFVGGMLVFITGLLLGFGEYLMAVVLAVLVTSILAVRRELHLIVRSMDRGELLSAIKFSIIAFVVLPLLQQYPITLFNILNLYDFWLIVVMVSLIQFASFILMRIFQAKGDAVIGFFGGFFNSSATTYTIAEHVKKKKDVKSALPAILLSILAMILSNIMISFIIFPSIESLQELVTTLIPSIFVLCVASLRNMDFGKIKPDIKSPYSLVSALKFAVIFFVLTILGEYFVNYSSSLLVPTSFIVGLISSTPMVASVSFLMGSGEVTVLLGTRAIFFAIIGSVINKNFWARVAENKDLSRNLLVYTSIVGLLTLGMTLL